MDEVFKFFMIVSPVLILASAFFWIRFGFKYLAKMIPLMAAGLLGGVAFAKWIIYCAETF